MRSVPKIWKHFRLNSCVAILADMKTVNFHFNTPNASVFTTWDISDFISTIYCVSAQHSRPKECVVTPERCMVHQNRTDLEIQKLRSRGVDQLFHTACYRVSIISYFSFLIQFISINSRFHPILIINRRLSLSVYSLFLLFTLRKSRFLLIHGNALL